MADPVDECAVHQFKEFGGKMLKSATKEGLDLGDDDEKNKIEELKAEFKPLKNKIEELKAEFKPLTKLMKEILGDNVEMVIASDRIVDSPCVPSTSEYGWSAKIERIMEAQALRDNSMTSHMVSEKTIEVNPTHSIMMELMKKASAWQQQHKSSKHQPQTTQQERRDRRKGKGEKVEGEEWETVVVKGRKGQRERGQEGKRRKEARDLEVKKDVTDWTVVTRKKKKTVQVFVKVGGSRVTPIEVSLSDDKVEDILRQVQNDEDAYVTLHGRVLKRGEKLKSCGVTDGCTIQVTSRMRGGGKHKDKKSKGEKKQVAQLDDGMCAMACEQMRWMTESVNTLQSTDEDKRRLAEEVDKVRKMMAGVEKQVTGEDLQRVAEMAESLKKLEEEVQAKDVDDQKMTMNFAETGGKKDTREGRGCAGLVQGGDETHRMNETSGKGKGKGNGGKGEHGGKGEDGRKGVQQSAKMLKGKEEQEADEEDERDRVAPNMGAGGSHPQATSDPREEEKEKKEARALRWADCDDKEEEEGWKRKVMWLDGSDEEERVSGRVEMWSEENKEPEVEEEKETGQEKTTDEKPPGLEEVESESKTQQEEEPSQVESEQEAQEGEQRRTQEARELKRAQEAREDEERKAQEAREEEEKRAQEAREEEGRVQEAREEQRRAQEAQEAKAQEEREREAKAQEEREKEVSAHEERREQDRDAEAQGGHERGVKAQEGHEGEVKAREEQGENANSLHEESHVSNRHMTWWRNAWWIRVGNGPHMQTARGRRRIWRAARRAAEQACDDGRVEEAWSPAEEADGKMWGQRKGERQTKRLNANTLHIVLHLQSTATQTTTAAAAAATAAMRPTTSSSTLCWM